jgi:uncharacterized protein YdeI (YjbR/CyaY-like superfamily)
VSNAENQPNGHGPEGCDENGPAAALLVGYVSILICALLAPCRRPILIATKAMLFHGQGTSIPRAPDRLTTDSSMKIITFTSPRDLRAWFAKNHNQSDGTWLRFYKKNSGVTSVTHAEALDQALCFGWIDGQAKPYDEQSWLQKFTPRRSKSGWSKINTQHAERLIASGEMAPAGLKEVNAAKADGRWAAAYDSFSNAAIPEDFLKKLDQDKAASAFFKTLNKTNLYSIAYRLQTAKKPETRERRMEAIIEKLARGEKFH